MAVLWEPVNGVYTAAVSSASWLPSFESVQSLGESSFFVTVFGALAGAYFGAWAAQRNSENSKLRDELQKEIRNVNSALVVNMAAVNIAYALKKQHVKDLKASYDSDCARFEEYRRKSAAGLFQPPFDLQPNFLTLQVISPPIASLQEIVMGKLTSTGRALASMSALADAVENLNYAIAGRNEIIEKAKTGNLPEGAQVHHIYFGLPYAGGKCNGEYGGYIAALSLYTDDAIFFGLKLFDDLGKHGASLATKYQQKFGGEAPKITTADWKKAEDEGLLPKDEGYESWLSGFQERKPDPQTKWERVSAWFKRSV